MILCVYTHIYIYVYVYMQVGAPPEVVARLEEACASAAAAAAMGHVSTGCLGEDPALDQFMEAYCEMLAKYEQELSKPFKEAMLYLQKIECQFKALTFSSSESGIFIVVLLFFFGIYGFVRFPTVFLFFLPD